MAAVHYRLSAKEIDGRSEVLVRFYGSRTIDQRAKTGIFVPSKHWNKEQQRLSISKRFVTRETIELQALQKDLDGLHAFILSRFMEDKVVIQDGWLADTIAEYFGRSTPVLTTASEAIAQYLAENDLQPNTAKMYKVVAYMLDRYARAHVPIYMETATRETIDAFAAFIRYEERKGRIVERAQNTINCRLKKLRAVFAWWCLLEDGRHNPFDRYKIEADVYGTPIWLTIEERNKVAAATMPSKSLEVQRDIFVFHCLVGCRVGDLYTLTADNITDDGFLQYIQTKLRKKVPDTIRVPLSPSAMALVDKYQDESRRSLFPFIAVCKYNAAIKKILRAAAIDRVVLVLNKTTYENEPRPLWSVASTHLARKTFAANLYKQVKDERMVSALTGHSGRSSSFLRYVEIDDEMRREMVGKIE